MCPRGDLWKCIIGGIAALATFAFVAWYGGDTFHLGMKSARAAANHCPDVERPRYPLRHWQWSGIFPFGEFLPDPHYLCSQPQELHPEVLSMLGVTSGTFQLVDVNPFFEDGSSEVVLAISTGDLHELRLIVSSNVRAVLSQDKDPLAEVFATNDNQLLIWVQLFSIDGPVTGFATVPWPMGDKVSTELIPVESREGEALLRQVAALLREASWKARLCGRSWVPLRELVEATVGSNCD